MNYPERGTTVYQDVIYLLFFISTNFFILSAFVGIIFLIMLRCGYKSITIKFNKKNKLLKQSKNTEKIKEKFYFSKLEKKLKNK